MTPTRSPQAAPDRPRDLHPLQHLRGDLPGRRDHARRPQLRRRSGEVQLLHGLHLAVPDRLDRQLAHGAEGRARTPIDEQLTWDELPAERAVDEHAGGDAAADRRDGGRRGRAGARARSVAARRSAVGLARAAVVGGASVRQPVRPQGADHGDGRRQLPRAPSSAPTATRITSCSTSARTPFPVLEGQSIGILPPGVDARGRPHHRAPVLDREPARRRAPRLQQRLADREARHRRPRTAGRSAASPRTTSATSRKATRCR